VVVIEFSDFGCVFCARFHSGSYEALRDEFVTQGDVIWRYIPVTIGGFPNGDAAASAALCVADQADFPPIRDRLYADREIWLRQTGSEAREQFRSYAAEQSIDMDAWEACVDAPDTLRRLEMANRAAAAAGVRGTPSFLVQGFLVQGAPVLENFQLALRQLVADTRAGDP
jgi:protein-disulfide isomerase